MSPLVSLPALTLGPADYNFMDPTGTLYTAPTPARGG